MNKIQNYGINNISSNYQQAKCDKVSNTINFKALHMPPKDEFVKLGEKCMEELEAARPKFERIAEENPKIECFVEPNSWTGGVLQVSAKYARKAGDVNFPINIAKAVEDASKKSISFGDYVVNMLKDAVELAKNGVQYGAKAG